MFSSLLSQEGVQQLCVCVCLSDTKQFPRSRRSGEKSSSHRSLQSISLKVVVQRTGRKRKKDHDAGDKTNKGCFLLRKVAAEIRLYLILATDYIFATERKRARL